MSGCVPECFPVSLVREKGLLEGRFARSGQNLASVSQHCGLLIKIPLVGARGKLSCGFTAAYLFQEGLVVCIALVNLGSTMKGDHLQQFFFSYSNSSGSTRKGRSVLHGPGTVNCPNDDVVVITCVVSGPLIIAFQEEQVLRADLELRVIVRDHQHFIARTALGSNSYDLRGCSPSPLSKSTSPGST